jgi:protoheme ferro-lyase
MYEVDILFAEGAKAAGITGYFRPDALNTHPLFISALKRLVLEKVEAGRAAQAPEFAGVV